MIKKLIYTSAFSLLALGFVACSEAEDDTANSENEIETADEVSSEKVDELNKTIELQEKAEKLDAELDEFIETL